MNCAHMSVETVSVKALCELCCMHCSVTSEGLVTDSLEGDYCRSVSVLGLPQ